MTLLAYANKLSVRHDETVEVMISADAPYELRTLRLHGPGPNEAEPVDMKIEGSTEPTVQPLRPGSYAHIPDPDNALTSTSSWTIAAWFLPTTPMLARPQTLIDMAGRARLVVDDGALVLYGLGLPDGGLRHPRQVDRDWQFVVGSFDAASRQFKVALGARGDTELTGMSLPGEPGLDALSGHVSFAARLAGDPPVAGEFFNGRLDSPMFFRAPLDDVDVGRLLQGDRAGDVAPDTLMATWDLGRLVGTNTILDITGRHGAGRLVNGPSRAVPGVRWDGIEEDFRKAPDQFAALHFHDDDLDDASWDSTISFQVPRGLASGVYAIHLTADHDDFFVPFYVRGSTGQTNDIAVLIPTLTYLAYSNWRQAHESIVFAHGDYSRILGHEISLHPVDEWLNDHPEVGLSLYERHSDLTGVMYASLRRPIANLRPDYTDWKTGAHRHFSADLLLVRWLERRGFAFDVITEHDLHLEGPASIAGYRTVITGSHPEYYTAEMLDALFRHRNTGGHLMYLGGNGFDVVSAVDPERPHVMEIRRGFQAGPWLSESGETHLSLTGEPGGRWLRRGRPAHALVGVGFAAVGWEGGAGYARMSASYDPRVAFIFDGIGRDEVIGNFGNALGGAAGDEIDSYDVSRGTPEQAFLLASSVGRHSEYYESLEGDRSDAPVDQRVRADLTYFEAAGGGRVFSVGSMNWVGSLNHDDGDNNVSRITENVLRHFSETGKRALDPEPLSHRGLPPA